MSNKQVEREMTHTELVTEWVTVCDNCSAENNKPYSLIDPDTWAETWSTLRIVGDYFDACSKSCLLAIIDKKLDK